MFAGYRVELADSRIDDILVERQTIGTGAWEPKIDIFMHRTNPGGNFGFSVTLDEAEELALVLQAVINTYKRDGE